MKISEILHEAADIYLCDGIDGSDEDKINVEYSCDAVQNAVIANGGDFYKVRQIKNGLEEMGVNLNSFSEFKEFEIYEQRQAACYSWLKFAAMIAEEQGV